jgi:hypothetical protein
MFWRYVAIGSCMVKVACATHQEVVESGFGRQREGTGLAACQRQRRKHASLLHLSERISESMCLRNVPGLIEACLSLI